MKTKRYYRQQRSVW